jgi:hypothetical protein
MDEKLYVIRMKDNSVRIMNLIKGDVVSEYLRWVDGDQVESYKEILREDIPDREFRNAWRWDGEAFGHDLVAAKDMQLERIRLARKPKMDELDAAYLIADEQNNAEEKARIALEKQEFRDITEPLKALSPSNIDEIKNAFPDSLLEFK